MQPQTQFFQWMTFLCKGQGQYMLWSALQTHTYLPKNKREPKS